MAVLGFRLYCFKTKLFGLFEGCTKEAQMRLLSRQKY